jgi:hypothetical protein
VNNRMEGPVEHIKIAQTAAQMMKFKHLLFDSW